MLWDLLPYAILANNYYWLLVKSLTPDTLRLGSRYFPEHLLTQPGKDQYFIASSTHSVDPRRCLTIYFVYL